MTGKITDGWDPYDPTWMRGMDDEPLGSPDGPPRNYGETNGRCSLTDADIAAIRSLHGKMTQAEIARRFGTSQPHVSNILAGKLRVEGSRQERYIP